MHYSVAHEFKLYTPKLYKVLDQLSHGREEVRDIPTVFAHSHRILTTKIIEPGYGWEGTDAVLVPL